MRASTISARRKASAKDATKNGYNGTYAEQPASGPGLTTPLAPSFDGASDYIQSTIPTNVGTRTLEAWILSAH